MPSAHPRSAGRNVTARDIGELQPQFTAGACVLYWASLGASLSTDPSPSRGHSNNHVWSGIWRTQRLSKPDALYRLPVKRLSHNQCDGNEAREDNQLAYRGLFSCNFSLAPMIAFFSPMVFNATASV